LKPAEKTILEPMAGFYMSYLSEGGFSETAAGAANLAVDPRRSWVLRSYPGPKLRQGLSYAGINLDFEITAL
jgi:hypothetical protein